MNNQWCRSQTGHARCAECGLAERNLLDVTLIIQISTWEMGLQFHFPIPFLKRLTGATFPNPLTSASYNRRNSNLFPNTPEKMFAMFEKAYSQKMADKIADKIVNFDITYQIQPAYYNYNVTNPNYANDFYTSIKDLYGLEMHVCPKCLMIEPAKISYAKGEPSAGIRSSISFPCSPPPNYESESQKGQHQKILLNPEFILT